VFWTNEDLDDVQPLVTEVFGSQAPMLEVVANQTIPNVVVWNKSLGKLWYGDVASLEDLKNKALLLSKKMSKEICVSFMDSDTFFTTPKFVFTQL
jgi:hypothetical protein